MQAIRNIAIIAHVDHGKTTLVDQLLRQSGTFRAHQAMTERIMDSNDLEKERGITILAKNCAIEVDGTRINIVDTPGHADFGGEVERALSMVDSVLLVVDAVDGPMPQTRFVTRKALALGLKPILVVNKIDRPGSRPHWVIDQVFELFDKLGASAEQMDFPIVYCSALAGFAVNEIEEMEALPRAENGMPQGTMRALYDAILKHVPQRADDVEGPLQMQILSIDWSSYVGRIGVGRINRGRVTAGMQVQTLHGPDSKPVMSKVNQVLRYKGLERIPMDGAEAGDIVAVTGVDGLDIGATICAMDAPDALPLLKVDEPTLTMEFMVNTSPLAGREGKYVTSRQIRDRLERELQSNVALRVEFPSDSDTFVVSGRGELHLTILLENMRREGYEMAVSRPKPKVRINPETGVKEEPFETLAMDVEDQHQGAVMEYLGTRRADMTNMEPDGKGRVRLDYRVPARGLIGFHSEFLNITRGTGIMSHVFDDYAPMAGPIEDRRNGVLISGDDGGAVAYALWKLDDRGRMFVVPGEELYEGMIIGIHTRDNDLIVNPVKEKKLTNVRSAGKDDAIVLTPPMQLTLEKAVEFIADDELVEITPKSIRLRKRHLKEHERKRASRETEAA
ncbi:MAG: translational GTPase TypA [Burkholderiales bacterium]|nr:translational GTPase TypA [Burkholderiales bacterium]